MNSMTLQDLYNAARRASMHASPYAAGRYNLAMAFAEAASKAFEAAQEEEAEEEEAEEEEEEEA